MKEKIETIKNLFHGEEIRSIWDKEREEYYFSVVDVIRVLTDGDYQKSRNYWKWLKSKLIKEGSELVSNTSQLKMESNDGKYYLTDVLDTKGILRLIESVPSKKAEPFKMWLAGLGKERIEEVFDPEKAISRSINYYKKRGYSDEWIEKRLKGIINRNKLTEVWKEGEIEEGYEYAILTNEIYKGWCGMTASEYKSYKGLRKESLRDNMNNIEVILTDLGEEATRKIASKEKPYGLMENKKVALRGGNVAYEVRKALEKEIKESVISEENNLNYEYQKELK